MPGQGNEDFSAKLAQFWNAYRTPVILGLVSILFIIISLTILLKSVQTSTPITFSSDEASVAGAMRGSDTVPAGRQVVVDVAGAVSRPGVYTVPAGSRVEDAIVAAGGLSADVDEGRLAKVVNRAAKLSDGAKLYIPKVGDTKTSQNIMTGRDPANQMTGIILVSVNAASQQELEALSGIGPATAKKIIGGRPYQSLEELVGKKAMGGALFDKLKNQLTL
ncbi:helix-hairpin-helix domain-containing protein [Candidatus Gottesmanbacteria bacterium]|nr:helix-hairpin-helix domain-containing protein [Candidatus Gottesmanbacteria bacterium]